jgi:TPP-dependent pyruvate/acetoin dehydrogenase alpha subunit
MGKLLDLYYDMVFIREFELRVLKLFSEGKLFGTTHAYIGQEANAVGVISNLNHDDIVVSNHRCHGHYLAFKNNPYELLCELMGKEDGSCGGRGGSQHIYDDNFFTNGIQGGIVPLAAGLAFAEKEKGSSKIVAIFIGDGTLGQGVLYEGLNITSKWELPLLFVLENNRYAQSTKIEHTLSGTVSERFTAFGIDHK